MPRLKDLLQYLATPGLEELWLLLDIKLDNNADDVMRLIASTIESVTSSSPKAWKGRVVLGIWATKYLPLCEQYLPGYPISHIGFSTTYAAQFRTKYLVQHAASHASRTFWFFFPQQSEKIG